MTYIIVGYNRILTKKISIFLFTKNSYPHLQCALCNEALPEAIDVDVHFSLNHTDEDLHTWMLENSISILNERINNGGEY